MAFSFKRLRQVRRRIRHLRAARKAQVIGLCRFSYPALGGFQIEHDTPETRAAYLYAPERLDERFRLFEAITLPSIRNQTDPNFTFLIVIGDDFPPERRAQLEALTRDVPQVVIQAHPPGRHRDVMKDAINSLRKPGVFSIQFRNDDDDAINLRFVEKLRYALADCFPLFAGSQLVSVSFTRGYNARISPQGLLVEPELELMPAVSCAIVVRPGNHLTVMNFAHHEVWRHMPVISRTDPDMWIRGVNDHNDSRANIGRELKPLAPKHERKFQQVFGIDSDVVREIARRD